MTLQIFQPELSSIDAQLAALQAQIAAMQEQRVALNKAEAVAASIVQAVRGGVEEFQQIAGIGADAIARVKSAVLDIFGGNPDNGNDDGNTPAPRLQPKDNGGAELAIANKPQAEPIICAPLKEALFQANVELATELTNLGLDAIDAPREIPYTEARTEVTDVPTVEATDVNHGIQVIHTADGEVKFHLHWTRLSDRVATYSSPENPYNWEGGFVSYLGFATKEVAESWQQHLLKIGAATKCVIRKVNRLRVDCPKGVRIRWEMKCHGLSDSQLQDILTFDLTQAPQSEHKASASDFEVCDRVKILNTSAGSSDKRIGECGVVQHVNLGVNMLEVKADSSKLGGTLLMKPEWVSKLDALQYPACCTLPESEILTALAKFQAGDRVKVVKPWDNGDTRDMGRLGTVNRLIVCDGLIAVDLDDSTVERQYTPDTIEPLEIQDLVPEAAGETVEDVSTTDWKAEAQKLSVRLDYSAPGHFICYHSYRRLGEIIEKHDADSLYYVNRNQRTMLNVGKGDGQKYSDPHEAAISLAKFLKVIKDAEESKADLFGGGYDVPVAQQQNTESEGKIQSLDWVELPNGDRCQVTEVDNEGIHLACDSGNMLAQPDEVKLLFRVPATWQPF